MIVSIAVFHICLFSVFALFNYLEFDVSGFIKVIFFACLAFVAIYPKIKKEGRLLKLNEKIIFVLSTWGVYTLLTLSAVFLLIDKDPTTPGIFIVAFDYFLSFCGVWLVISTFSERLFENLIKNA